MTSIADQLVPSLQMETLRLLSRLPTNSSLVSYSPVPSLWMISRSVAILAEVPQLTIQVKGVGKTFSPPGDSVFDEIKTLKTSPVDAITETSKGGKVSSRQEVYVSPPGTGKGSRVDTPVFQLEHLDIGDEVAGPALIIDATQTIFVNA
jgi:hypothetical protein